MVFAVCGLAPRSARGQDVTGDWHGTLRQGSSELRIVLHIARAADGSLNGTLDRVDQGASGVTMSSVKLIRARFAFAVPADGLAYAGQMNRAGTAIAGTWTQGSAEMLEFTRAAGPMILPARVTPNAAIEAVAFKAGSDSVTPGVAVAGSDDWLKNISVTIKNVSKKNIVAVNVKLHLPDTGDGSVARPFSDPEFKLSASAAAFDATQNPTRSPGTPGADLPLRPGQEMTIALAPHYDPIKASLESNRPMATIQKCMFTFSAYFSDGTAWMMGTYYEPDPTRAGVWAPITFQQFSQYVAK